MESNQKTETANLRLFAYNFGPKIVMVRGISALLFLLPLPLPLQLYGYTAFILGQDGRYLNSKDTCRLVDTN